MASTLRPINLMLFIILAIIALLALAAPAVIPQPHAVERHGDDAIDIRQCVRNTGPAQVWKERRGPTYYLTCRLPDGRWGLMAIVQDYVNGVKSWVEKTAFVRGDGTLTALTRYLEQFATRTGGLP